MIQTEIQTAGILSTDGATIVPTGTTSVQMGNAFLSMLYVKTTPRSEPAHLATKAFNCQVAIASQQPETILIAKVEIP